MSYSQFDKVAIVRGKIGTPPPGTEPGDVVVEVNGPLSLDPNVTYVMPITVVFSDIKRPTPRTMNEVPSVTMNAGTLSLAMIVPLISPTTPAPATAASKPATTEKKSGSPELKAARRASAESTEARLITQPTDRSIPALMITNVWPRPSSRTGVIATRIFCELRTVRKLTAPPL